MTSDKPAARSAVAIAIVFGCRDEISRCREERLQTFGSQNSATQRQRNSVSDERIDECSRITNHKNVPAERFWFVKGQSGRRHRFAQLHPFRRSLLERRVKGENLYQACCDIAADHRARIDSAPTQICA